MTGLGKGGPFGLAESIEKKLKVRFHPHYLREWLSKRNYIPRKPARRAKQRNPEAIDRWLVRKAPGRVGFAVPPKRWIGQELGPLRFGRILAESRNRGGSGAG
jgi:hypothetical protein